MESVFVLQHSHTLPDGVEDVKFIGVYRSLDAARSAVERLRVQPGFSRHPNIIDPGVTDEEDGFYIGEYELDVDQWPEGYITMVGDRDYEDL
jgi:hypothetical protein